MYIGFFGGGGEGNHPDLQRGGRDRGQQRQIPQGTKMGFFVRAEVWGYDGSCAFTLVNIAPV